MSSLAFNSLAEGKPDDGYKEEFAWSPDSRRLVAMRDIKGQEHKVYLIESSPKDQVQPKLLSALEAHWDFYKVAVADCGCHDNRMDKIWWNEQWMGWPVGPHYAEQSNVTNAAKMQGKLLLFVGELDHNFDPASTMQVVNALEKANQDFDLIVMTGSDHGSAENPYGIRRRRDFSSGICS